MRRALLALAVLAACAAEPKDVTAPPLLIVPDAAPAAAGELEPAALEARARRLFERALEDGQAIVHLRDLIAAAPRRLAGSDGAMAAVAFAMARLRAVGCDRVVADPVLVPKWVRGVETAAVIAPSAQPLRIAALGGSIATPAGGIEAEVLMVRSFEQLQQDPAAAAGKIVFFNRPMPRALARTFQAYGEAVPQRTSGAVEAAKVGGAAALVRSVTTAIDGYPHTGAMNYVDGIPRVPAAAIATADADALAVLLQQGPVTVRLELGCATHPDVEQANVLGELRGSARPDEIVVIGAHLDAWDLGDGAHDDGAGCAQVIEAIRLLRVCGLAPKRTIRAVLFANEENGLRGGAAYAAQHGREPHAAAIETDAGGFSPQGFTCSLPTESAAPLRALFAPLAAYGAGTFLPGGGGGADIGPLKAHGVPLFGLITDGQRYFDYHHTAANTLDKVNDRELALGAAAIAYAASVLADR